MASRLLRNIVPQLRVQPTTRFITHRLFSAERGSGEGLAAEALAQKVGGSAPKKATLPKGDKKPAKAAGVAGAATGLSGLALFHYGKWNQQVRDKVTRF
jgi:hypothetical protein